MTRRRAARVRRARNLLARCQGWVWVRAASVRRRRFETVWTQRSVLLEAARAARRRADPRYRWLYAGYRWDALGTTLLARG